MFKAIHTAATGMSAQEQNVNTIANNIANVNTTGFKTRRAEFEDLYYHTIKEPGARSSSSSKYNVGLQIGSGSKMAASRMINAQGNPIITKNAFDLMINGNGYFGVIGNNNQIRYTRDGSFNVNNDGIIVSKDGNTLFPGINIPRNTVNVNITKTGEVEAFTSGNPNPEIVGVVPVFTFANPAGLKNEGNNYLVQSSASGQPIENIPGEQDSGIIQQGMLESSNVNIMNEMTNMIKAQRAYEMNSKVMGMADQMLNSINTVR